MADSEAPFSWRSDASAGYGALDDFAVHPMSLVSTLIGCRVRRSANCEALPRPAAHAGRRAVETFDIATALLRMRRGRRGRSRSAAPPGAARAAWLQIFGARGAIFFDQERFNEVGVYLADGPVGTRGSRRC